MLCHAPESGTLAQPMHMQEGKARTSRKACTFIEAAVEDRKRKQSYCARHHPYPEFLLQYSSPEGSHWEVVQED